MIELLFWLTSYVCIGAAVTYGIRVRGLKNWCHIHSNRCHTCGTYVNWNEMVYHCGRDGDGLYWGKWWKDVSHCWTYCDPIWIGKNPMPIIHLILTDLCWPLLCVYILIAWIFHFSYLFIHAVGIGLKFTFFWVPLVFNVLGYIFSYKV